MEINNILTFSFSLLLTIGVTSSFDSEAVSKLIVDSFTVFGAPK